MGDTQPVRRVALTALTALMAVMLGAALAACGSSSTPATHAATPTAAATTPAAASGSAATKITANWQAFFSAKTPIAQRVSLLQNGQAFAKLIKAQAGSTLAASATAKVVRVSMVSPAKARVTYSILVGGQPMLTNQAGVAVLQDGTWKVGDSSFCGLLALENGGKTSGLPAACRSAG